MTIPAPALTFDGALEKPVNLSFAGVKRGDGSVFDESSLGTAAYLIYRERSSGSGLEVWNKDTKEWAAGDGLKGEDLAFKDGAWTGLLVAAGKTDKNGKPQFEKHVGGFPRYRFAGLFVDKAGDHAIGPKSAPVAFVSASDKNLIGVLPRDGEQPDSATQARLFLKADPSRTIAQVRIENDGNLILETLNAGGTVQAAVTVAPDGAIRLKGRLIVEGDIEVGHVSYLDASNVRRTLP